VRHFALVDFIVGVTCWQGIHVTCCLLLCFIKHWGRYYHLKYLNLQEPEKAVKAFDVAIEFNPRDGELVARVARALATTHDYQGALDAYARVKECAVNRFWRSCNVSCV
jgi:tetratricopeptide (TPR) repeat protein